MGKHSIKFSFLHSEKATAESQGPLQEVDESPFSGLNLLVSIKLKLNKP